MYMSSLTNCCLHISPSQPAVESHQAGMHCSIMIVFTPEHGVPQANPLA